MLMSSMASYYSGDNVLNMENQIEKAHDVPTLRHISKKLLRELKNANIIIEK